MFINSSNCLPLIFRHKIISFQFYACNSFIIYKIRSDLFINVKQILKYLCWNMMLKKIIKFIQGLVKTGKPNDIFYFDGKKIYSKYFIGDLWRKHWCLRLTYYIDFKTQVFGVKINQYIYQVSKTYFM